VEDALEHLPLGRLEEGGDRVVCICGVAAVEVAPVVDLFTVVDDLVLGGCVLKLVQVHGECSHVAVLEVLHLLARVQLHRQHDSQGGGQHTHCQDFCYAEAFVPEHVLESENHDFLCEHVPTSAEEST